MSDDVTIDPDGIYLITAAARLLGVSASTLRDLDRQGKIESTRTPGGQRRFTGSALLQLRAESHRVHPRTSRPAAASTATDADAKARQAWLGQVMARAQRELPADTPAEIRLRLGADVERALGHFGPSSPVDAVEPLVKSLVERARIQGEHAQEEAERRAMKGELIDGALAELRRRIDTLSKRVVGAPGSLKRRHVQATLRDQLRDRLRKRLRGDEDWDQVRELAVELLAAWYVEQTPGSRIPKTVQLLVAGATGVVGGAAGAAALSPEIRAHAAKLKTPLLSAVGELLTRLSGPTPPTSPPPSPAGQAAPASPPFRPSVGVGVGWPGSYRRTSRYSRSVTPKSPEARPEGLTPSDDHVRDAAPTHHDPGPQDSARVAPPPA
jgi:excisionase family DNA binding protein